MAPPVRWPTRARISREDADSERKADSNRVPAPPGGGPRSTRVSLHRAVPPRAPPAGLEHFRCSDGVMQRVVSVCLHRVLHRFSACSASDGWLSPVRAHSAAALCLALAGRRTLGSAIQRERVSCFNTLHWACQKAVYASCLSPLGKFLPVHVVLLVSAERAGVRAELEMRSNSRRRGGRMK